MENIVMDEMQNNNTEPFDPQSAIQQIMEIVNNLANEVAEIKSTIMDELITPIQDEYNQMQYDNALSDWRCKYGEKLDGFSDRLKAIEGEDFDIVKQSFDDFNERTDGMEPDTFVDQLVESVNEQLNTIAAAFGVEPEKVEEITVETTDGEEKTVEVEDGQVVEAETEGETEVEESTAEEPVEEPAEEETASEESDENTAAEKPVPEEPAEEKDDTEEAESALGIRRKEFLDSLKR